MDERAETLSEQPQQKPIVFDNVEDVPLLYSNAFWLQGTDDSMFVLNVGQYAPPLIPADSNEERGEKLDALPEFHAKTIARLAVTPDRLRDLANILANFVRLLDAQPRYTEQKESEASHGR